MRYVRSKEIGTDHHFEYLVDDQIVETDIVPRKETIKFELLAIKGRKNIFYYLMSWSSRIVFFEKIDGEGWRKITFRIPNVDYMMISGGGVDSPLKNDYIILMMYSTDGTYRIFKINTNRWEIITEPLDIKNDNLEDHRRLPVTLKVSRNGENIVYSDSKKVVHIDRDLNIVKEFSLPKLESSVHPVFVDFVKDDKTLLFSSERKTLILIDLESGSLLDILTIEMDLFKTITINREGFSIKFSESFEGFQLFYTVKDNKIVETEDKNQIVESSSYIYDYDFSSVRNYQFSLVIHDVLSSYQFALGVLSMVKDNIIDKDSAVNIIQKGTYLKYVEARRIFNYLLTREEFPKNLDELENILIGMLNA